MSASPPEGLNRWHAAAARHRRGIGAAGLAAGVGLAWLLTPAVRWLGVQLASVGVALVVGAAGLFLALNAAVGKHRPACLVVDPRRRAFSTPPSPILAYVTVCQCLFAPLILTQRWSDTGPDRGHGWDLAFDIAITAPWLLAIAIHVVWASPRWGLRLHPDGIHDVRMVGTLTVPWEAIAPGHPCRPALNAQHLALACAHPGLVRRRGAWAARPHMLPIAEVHPWFIADVLRHYVDHPQHRHAIGTPAEYDRLRALLVPGEAP